MPTITIEIPDRLLAERDVRSIEREVATLLKWMALQILSQELHLTKEEAEDLERRIKEEMREWVLKRVR